MNEADRKVIEELLARQTESFGRAIDIRFREQAQYFEERLDTRFKEQEERFDTRFKEQEEHLEKRMIHIFNEGFEQVVFPHVLEIREDISSMKKDIEDLTHKSDRIERKVNAIMDHQDRQGEEIKGIKKFIQMPEGA